MNARNTKSQGDLFTTIDGRLARTTSSMVWAAYADAIGFISELVDEKGLLRRTKGAAALDVAISWRRRVGGRGGVDAVLPAGCWSDDTQLRMAVSRTLGPRGFDVEAFAKVELPVWPAYALGGGRASKAAAGNLSKAEVRWYANTFDGWTNAGGNGAAMRIQPHVWAAADLEHGYQQDVVADAVVTHGHPRAIVGALFHAGTLAHTLRSHDALNLNACLEIAAEVNHALKVFDDHRHLGETWCGLWEQATGRSFSDEWRSTVDELSVAIDLAMGPSGPSQDLKSDYLSIVDRLGLRDPEQRGSGLLTPVAAAALAGLAPNTNSAVLVAVNALGTDTDTIATMAAAILGARWPEVSPEIQPIDSAYLAAEAERLVAISKGEEVECQSYPDLLTWTAPVTQADALVQHHDQLVVEGLGVVSEDERPIVWTGKHDFGWQWVITSFGQSLLIKRRPTLRTLGASNTLAPPPSPPTVARKSGSKDRQADRTDTGTPIPIDRGVNLDGAIEHAIHNIGDDQKLGYTLRRVARDGTFADLVAFVTALRDELRR
ncbi:MAG: ADP-ribosylglycohydrolase family protein [Microthrixaceae bacterium]